MNVKTKKSLGDKLRERRESYSRLSSKEKQAWWGNFLANNAMYIIIAALIIYVEIYSITNHFSNTFLSFTSIVNVLKLSASSVFLALGVGGIIVLTGTDLSAGRIMGLTACISASLLQLPVTEFAAKMFPNLKAPPIILVIVLLMIVGGLIGMFNGFCVSKFKLHPFIVTLATQLMIYGFVLMYVQLGNNGGGPISGLTQEYKDVVKGTIDVFGVAIPFYVFYAIIAVIIMWIIWNKTCMRSEPTRMLRTFRAYRS